MLRRSLLGIALAGGCAGSGRVSLDFDVPDDPALQPTNASTLTLIARVGDDAPRATTAMIGNGGSVDLGDLPVSDDVWLSAEMRTPQGQLAGFGRAPGAVSISATEVTRETIPIRRPYAYLAGAGARLVSVDSSISPSAVYQGQVATTGTSTVIADVAGTDIAAITAAGALTYVSTASNGASALPGAKLAGAPKDAIATPDGAYLVVGHQGAISVVHTSDGAIASKTVSGNVDRVAVTQGADGGWWGVGLIGRATTDSGCTPSQLAVFPLTAPDTAMVIGANVGLSDLAGDVRTGTVLLADRCGDRVLSFDPVSQTIDTTSPILDIPSPTAVAADAGHVWAIGHAIETSNDPNLVPDGIVDAWLILGSADLTTGSSSVDALPPLVERTLATEVNYPDQDIAQDLHANSVVADDLVVMPGGEHLGITLAAVMAGDALVNQNDGAIVIPSLDMQTREFWLLDASTRAPTQRVRTDCSLQVGSCDFLECILENWACLPDVDAAAAGSFTPTGVIALFGAR